MLLKSEVKIDEIYGFDVEGQCSSIHKPTKTVKLLEVLEIPEQHYMDKVSPGYTQLTVECQQTGQLFTCGTHMLTTINRVKKMYEGYKNAVLEDKEKDYEMYSYDKTVKKLEDILFQLDINALSLNQ
jgi:hypothetical protein